MAALAMAGPSRLQQAVRDARRSRGKTPGTQVQHTLGIAMAFAEFRHSSPVGSGSIRASPIFARGFAPLTSPVVIDGTTRLNLEGYRLRYHGAAPALRHGVLVDAKKSDADDIRISDVNIVSSTGKLQAAVRLDQRNPRSMARIKISDVRSAGSASHGLYVSFDPIGGTPDRTPEISGIANGSDRVWTQTDQNDNPITA